MSSRSRKRIIPEEIQCPIRQRLRFARVQGQQSRANMKLLCGPSTLARWENSDISPMRLADVYAWGSLFDWSLSETLAYLAAQDAPLFFGDAKRFRTLLLLFRSLSPTLQASVLAMLEEVVSATTNSTPSSSTRSLQALSSKEASREKLAAFYQQGGAS